MCLLSFLPLLSFPYVYALTHKKRRSKVSPAVNSQPETKIFEVFLKFGWYFFVIWPFADGSHFPKLLTSSLRKYINLKNVSLVGSNVHPMLSHGEK